jgi:hypothetical protein
MWHNACLRASPTVPQHLNISSYNCRIIRYCCACFLVLRIFQYHFLVFMATNISLRACPTLHPVCMPRPPRTRAAATSTQVLASQTISRACRRHNCLVWQKVRAPISTRVVSLFAGKRTLRRSIKLQCMQRSSTTLVPAHIRLRCGIWCPASTSSTWTFLFDETTC